MEDQNRRIGGDIENQNYNIIQSVKLVSVLYEVKLHPCRKNTNTLKKIKVILSNHSA